MSFKVKDHYYKKAKKEKFLARSIYKLEEIDKKYKIITKNHSVLDLGYYPGSWIQYTSKKVGPHGNIVGVDIQEVNNQLSNLSNVKLFQLDIEEIESLNTLGVEDKFDVVVSDMAPKTTGMKDVDQLRSLALVEMVFDKLPFFLREDGNMVVKIFESHQAQTFIKENKKLFKKFHLLKPKSTRSVSKEIFAIGLGYKG